jgi:hypothetical protein
MSIGIMIGNIIGSSRGASVPAYWKNQSNFYELWTVTGAGNLVGLIRGDILTITGTGLNAIYAVPDTDAYKTRDTDYVFHKSDGSVSTLCDGNRLIAYDFAKIIVKYLDASPYTIEYIGILDTGQSVNNKMRDDFHLSIWWDNVLSDHGVIKQNRGIGQSVWTAESAYCAEAIAYFARMAVQPNTATKILLDAFFVGIKADGVYAELDNFCLYFLHTEQASLLDIKSDTRNHSTVGTPPWTAKTGYEIITSSYIRSHFIPLTDGIKYTLNDAAILFGVNPLAADGSTEGVTTNPVTANSAAVNNYGATYFLYNTINGSDNYSSVWTNGFNGSIRVDANNIIKRIGATETGIANVSSAVPSKEYMIGAYNDNGVVLYNCIGNIYRYYGFAAAMNLTKRNAFNTRLNTLYTEIQTAW